MQVDKAGIFIDCKKLKKVLRISQFLMTKADRQLYGNPIMAEIKAVIAAFVMAYDFPDDRDHYVRLMVAEFTNLRIDIEEMFEENILKSTDPEKIGGRAISVPGIKNEIEDYLARIDEGMAKYSKSADNTYRKDHLLRRLVEALDKISEGKGERNREAHPA